VDEQTHLSKKTLSPWRPVKQAATAMERSMPNLSNLFAQLGEASDEGAIARFIATHGPLDSDVQLHEATFWTPAQAAFLREAMLEDAEWAAIVDELNAELHSRQKLSGVSPKPS
jgi:hypothetical protein